MVSHSKRWEKKGNRDKILGEIIRNNGLRFNQIVDKVGLSRRIVSKHLGELKDKGLVRKKGGRFSEYIATKTGVEEYSSSNIKAKTIGRKHIPTVPISEIENKQSNRGEGVTTSGTISVVTVPGQQLSLRDPTETEEDDLIIRIPKSYLKKSKEGYVTLGWKRKKDKKTREEGKKNE